MKRDSRDYRRYYASLAVIVGLPAYVYCLCAHNCMAGHFQHPPYPLKEWVNDIYWWTMFISAGVFSIRSNMMGKKTFVALLAVMVFFGIVAATFIYESMAGIVVLGLAIRGLAGPDKGQKASKDAAASTGESHDPARES